MSLTSIRHLYIYIFSADHLDMPRSDWASSSVLFVYTCIHVRAPIKQMYFGSMNYATRI